MPSSIINTPGGASRFDKVRIHVQSQKVDPLAVVDEDMESEGE